MPEAARLHDEVSHSDEGLFMKIGAVVGAVVGAVMVGAEVVGEVAAFFTGALTLPAVLGLAGTLATASVQVAGMTSLGMFIGKTVGSYFHHKAGEIISAAATVFIGGQPAARGEADVGKCEDHDGSETSKSVPVQTGRRIAEGSETVFIETFHAARKGDKGTCLFRITSGCDSVIIGGAKVLLVNPDEMATSETPLLDKIMFITGVVSGVGALRQAFGKSAVEGIAAMLKMAGVIGASWEAGEIARQWAGGKWGEGSEQQEQATLTAQLAAGVLAHLGLNTKGGSSLVNSAAERIVAEGAATRDAMAAFAEKMSGSPLEPAYAGGGRMPGGFEPDIVPRDPNSPGMDAWNPPANEPLQRRITGLGGGDPDYVGPSGKAWNDPNMTEDEFIQDYRDRFPDTSLSDDQLRARFNDQDRLNPVTGRFINIDETPAVPAQYDPLTPEEQPPPLRDLSADDQAELQRQMDAREQDIAARDAAKQRMDALEARGEQNTPAYEQARQEWTDSFNRVNESSRQLGEHASDLYIQDQYAGTGNTATKIYPSGSGSRPGDFDAVYEVRNANGDVVGYDVVEAKGGSSPLGQARYNGVNYQQGHPEYFEGTANNMANNPNDPVMSDVGQKILDARQSGLPVRYMEVRAPINAQTSPQSLQNIEVRRFHLP